MDEANVTRDETETITYDDRDYYHINTLAQYSPYELLRVGDEVDVGGSTNPFFRYYEAGTLRFRVNDENGVPRPVGGVTFLDLLAEGQISVLAEPNITAEQKISRIASDVAHFLLTHLREVVWEDIRKTEFPDRPSRQRCIWLIPNQNGLRFWLHQMGVNVRDIGWQVVRVRVQGRLHKANQNYLLRDTEPMPDTIEKARKYWRGDEVEGEAETEEILFEGRMRVEEIMPPSFYS